MADDFNEAGRALSRQGDHARAERLFRLSAEQYGNRHSAANVVYEQHLQGKVPAQTVIDSVKENGIENTGHGQWLLKMVTSSTAIDTQRDVRSAMEVQVGDDYDESDGWKWPVR
jgi:hypothetical protein